MVSESTETRAGELSWLGTYGANVTNMMDKRRLPSSHQTSELWSENRSLRLLASEPWCCSCQCECSLNISYGFCSSQRMHLSYGRSWFLPLQGQHQHGIQSQWALYSKSNGFRFEQSLLQADSALKTVLDNNSDILGFFFNLPFITFFL